MFIEGKYENVYRREIRECLNRLEINNDLAERTKQTYQKDKKLCENKYRQV